MKLSFDTGAISGTGPNDANRGIAATVNRDPPTIDATLAAQNATVADESLGLSMVDIGALRNDPIEHLTREGQQWYFGMKAHIGVDSKSKVIHAMVATAANVHDATVLPDLLHGEETRVWGDQAHKGQTAVIREHPPNARDFANRRCKYRGVVDEEEKARNRTKSKARAKVEHSIGVIKRVFGFTKVRYRGLEKNAHRLFVTCALVNLFIDQKRLVRA